MKLIKVIKVTSIKSYKTYKTFSIMKKLISFLSRTNISLIKKLFYI